MVCPENVLVQAERFNTKIKYKDSTQSLYTTIFYKNNNMDAMECIYTRRSIRKYKDLPVEFELIGRIVEAASFAPTAGNIQDYRFIFVTDETQRKQLAEACMQQYWMEQAPVHIVACAEVKRAKQFYGARGERLYTVQNVAAAVENILLAAHSFGLGACWVGAFDEQMVKRICCIPDYARPHAIITIGVPDEVPPPPQKYKIENLFYFGKYSRRIKNVPFVFGEYSYDVMKTGRKVKEGIEKGAKSLLQRLTGKRG